MNLLIHQAALGDWVLCFPLIAALAPDRPGMAAQPNTLAVSHPSHAQLAARLFPHVEPRDAGSPALTSLFTPGGGDPATFAGIERIISFVSNGRDDWADQVRRLAPHAQLLCVQPRPPCNYPHHLTAWHRQQLLEQGFSYEVRCSDPHPSAARQRPSPQVVVHPGSGGGDKCWPAERFEALVRRLRVEVPVRVIVGQAESERWSADLLRRLEAQTLPDLPGLIEAIDTATLYIGNDAGPTHLAAWRGVPTIALFGPTDPTVWRPLGPVVHVLAPLRSESMTWLEVDRVLQAALAMAQETPPPGPPSPTRP